MKLITEKRELKSRFHMIILNIALFCVPLFIISLLLYMNGVNPINAVKDVYIESFMSLYGFAEILVKFIPLSLCALGVSVAFRMKLWNIGAEGQFYLGAIGASMAALFINTSSTFFMIGAMIFFAILFSGIWAVIAGFLKARYNVNEVIVTLMMNYIAITFAGYLVYGSWKDPNGFNFPQTAIFKDICHLSALYDTRLHTGIFLSLIAALIYYILIEKSIFGYEIRVIGDNQASAKYAGMNIYKNIIFVMFISGGLSGLGGFAEIAGVQHRFLQTISPGYGYTAIIIAWLGNNSPFRILAVSFLFSLMFIAGESLQVNYQLPLAMVNIFQGMILILILISNFMLNNKIIIKRQ